MYRIRINNQSAANADETCYTGNYWDAPEISWEIVAERAGYESFDEFIEEYAFAMNTSVTNKIRRVFEFPKERMAFVHSLVGGRLPDCDNVLYSMNFMNFIDRNVKGVKTKEELLTPKINEWLKANLEPGIRSRLCWIRTGPEHTEIVEFNPNELALTTSC